MIYEKYSRNSTLRCVFEIRYLMCFKENPIVFEIDKYYLKFKNHSCIARQYSSALSSKSSNYKGKAILKNENDRKYSNVSSVSKSQANSVILNKSGCSFIIDGHIKASTDISYTFK